MTHADIQGPVLGIDNATILGPCILGHPARGLGDDDPLVLGPGVVIRAYAVLYQGSRLGSGVHVGHGALIREHNDIAEGASIGSAAILEPRNRVGRRTRVHSGCVLASATLGDDVFCGPNVTFTDDPHPPCPSYQDCVGGATVGDGASIGSNATLLPGIHIGPRALIGAGSVVTHDIDPASVVAGNPARTIGHRDQLRCHVGIYPRAYAWELTP